MDDDKLACANQQLHDLERKLSLVLTSSLTYTDKSHGLVVHDPAFHGLARHNIQLSVLDYIRDKSSDFDADRVFSDRQHKFVTSFTREYSPSQSAPVPGDNPKTDPAPASLHELNPLATDSISANDDAVGAGIPEYDNDDYPDYFDEHFGSDYALDDASDDAAEAESDLSEGLLLSPLPPRLPPREMDPSKLYGLYDFLGPDPLHCTLSRDEPVYLLNDNDNYWWLIRKMNKSERRTWWLGRGSLEELSSDDEDGKVGFVPAECLETYGERLARLNCFKNEELERSLHEILPVRGSVLDPSTNEEAKHGDPDGPVSSEPRQGSITSFGIGRTSSILKKAGAYGQSNKLVTFENLGDIQLEDSEDSFDDVIDFADSYYAVAPGDVHLRHSHIIKSQDADKNSEVLSDVYSAEAPLQIRKLRSNNPSGTPESNEFAQPKLAFADDNVSIGSFSPDTPRADQFSKTLTQEDADEEDGGDLRRSGVLDRLSRVTLEILGSDVNRNKTPVRDLSFGKSLGTGRTSDEDSGGSDYDYESYFANESAEDVSRADKPKHGVYGENSSTVEGQERRKSLLSVDVSTPLTSANSLNCGSASPKAPVPAVERRKTKPVYDMFMPILGQLDELTERLAELERIL